MAESYGCRKLIPSYGGNTALYIYKAHGRASQCEVTVLMRHSPECQKGRSHITHGEGSEHTSEAEAIETLEANRA